MVIGCKLRWLPSCLLAFLLSVLIASCVMCVSCDGARFHYTPLGLHLPQSFFKQRFSTNIVPYVLYAEWLF